jgi:hypothetical protein
MFISKEKLAEITGYKAKSKQCKVLKEWGIPFKVNALGFPIVHESAFVQVKAETEPDFSVIYAAQK